MVHKPMKIGLQIGSGTTVVRGTWYVKIGQFTHHAPRTTYHIIGSDRLIVKCQPILNHPCIF